MVPKRLPSHLISLIHHIELNKAGWWEKTIDSLILSTLWMEKTPLDSTGLHAAIQCEFSVSIPLSKLEDRATSLEAKGKIALSQQKECRLKDSAIRSLDDAISEAEKAEERARGKFEEVLIICCPQLDPKEAWEPFLNDFLFPLVRLIGAKTYEVMSGTRRDMNWEAIFEEFSDKFEERFRVQLREAVGMFLDPADKGVREYVLRLLNTHFCLEASGLNDKALQTLSEATHPRFKILLDTNCVFSILQLHDHPANEAALGLLNLLTRLPSAVTASLYVLPPTVEEAKNTLINNQVALRGVRLTPGLAKAALRSPLSSIARKYMTTVIERAPSITPESYFGPYVRDLLAILRARKVQLFNENVDKYRMRQDVIDDVVGQLEYEKQKRKRHRKSYKTWLHDIILHHFVMDKRPSVVESPIRAEYWVVTLDHRLLAFDEYKRSALRSSVPVCLHPTTLIQMLRFWVPITEDFKKTILECLRLPFLLPEFDLDSKRITLSILSSLSRFENIDELPEETVTEVLINDALRQKLSTDKEIDEEQRLKYVRETLFQKHKEVKSRLVEKEATIDDLQTRLKGTTKERESLRRRISELENDRIRREGRSFFFSWVILPVLILAGVSAGVSFPVSRQLGKGHWQTAAVLFCILFVVLVGTIDRKARTCEAVKESKPIQFLHKFKKWVYTAFGAIILAILAQLVCSYFGGA